MKKNIPKVRSQAAVSAALRVGGPMKDRRTPRGGARNKMEEAMAELICDFCGEPVSKTRRIALDVGYDRLLPPTPALWACVPCSAKKEEERLGTSPVAASPGT